MTFLGVKRRGTHADADDDLPEVVSISRDRLSLILRDSLERVRSSESWHTPLAISVSLWVLVPITTFKSAAGLKSDQWQLLVILAASAATLWFVKALIGSRRAPRPNDVLRTICARADIRTDRRGIFFLKRRGADGVFRVLVYFDTSWECFLLPHADIAALDPSDVSPSSPLVGRAARTLGVGPKDLRLHLLRSESLRSRKFSEFYKTEKAYTFEFLHVEITVSIPPEVAAPTSVIGGLDFSWLSLAQMRADQNTAHRNADVIRWLDAHHEGFFELIPDSLPALAEAAP